MEILVFIYHIRKFFLIQLLKDDGFLNKKNASNKSRKESEDA